MPFYDIAFEGIVASLGKAIWQLLLYTGYTEVFETKIMMNDFVLQTQLSESLSLKGSAHLLSMSSSLRIPAVSIVGPPLIASVVLREMTLRGKIFCLVSSSKSE